MHRTVGLVPFCAKKQKRTKHANPDTFAKKRSAAGDQGVIQQTSISSMFDIASNK